ncbi:MAG: sphingomyelin phosphodiesterase [Bacteroidia bacterium]|nr:sphingomyelin phosphodiesterase [Bacteroidia bacterium]
MLRLLVGLFCFNLTFNLFSQVQEDCLTPDTFRVLTWNVYMLPRPFIRTGQFTRTKEIIRTLQNSDYDVIVLQEVFIERVKKQIAEGLKECYPYYFGPPGKDWLLKQDGGVIILSKHPIGSMQKIAFKDCYGFADCMADKGALLAEINKGNRRVQVIGTHLQSMDLPEAEQVRERQFKQIAQKLLYPFKHLNVPQLVVGDLNTCKVNQPNSYRKMLRILEAEDAHELAKSQRKQRKNERLEQTEELFTYNGQKNKLIVKSYQKTQEFLDYVLIRTNKALAAIKHSAIKIFQSKWSDRFQDLSDHYAVETVIILE